MECEFHSRFDWRQEPRDAEKRGRIVAEMCDEYGVEY